MLTSLTLGLVPSGGCYWTCSPDSCPGESCPLPHPPQGMKLCPHPTHTPFPPEYRVLYRERLDLSYFFLHALNGLETYEENIVFQLRILKTITTALRSPFSQKHYS